MTPHWMLSVWIIVAEPIRKADIATDQALLDGPKEPRQRSNYISNHGQARPAPNDPYFPQDLLEERQSNRLSIRKLPPPFLISLTDTT